MMLASTAMPTVKHDAGDARQGQGRSERSEDRQLVDDVEHHRDVGDEARHPVVDEHEQDDRERADIIENLALSTASRPSVGPTWVSKVFCSGAGSAPERRTPTRSLASCCSWNGSAKPPMVMRAWPPPMRALDDRRRVDLLVEDDGHLAADVARGRVLEERGAFVVEGQRDLRTAGLLIPGDLGILDVLAGELGAAMEIVGAPQLVLRGGALLVLRGDLLVADLVIGRHRVVALERREEALDLAAILGAQVDVRVLLARVLLGPAVVADLEAGELGLLGRRSEGRASSCTPSRRRRS